MARLRKSLPTLSILQLYMLCGTDSMLGWNGLCVYCTSSIIQCVAQTATFIEQISFCQFQVYIPYMYMGESFLSGIHFLGKALICSSI